MKKRITRTLDLKLPVGNVTIIGLSIARKKRLSFHVLNVVLNFRTTNLKISVQLTRCLQITVEYSDLEFSVLSDSTRLYTATSNKSDSGQLQTLIKAIDYAPFAICVWLGPLKSIIFEMR